MKLHIGCGPHYIDDMFNIDLREDCKTDYCGDLFDLASIDHPQHIINESVELIWSCHMLEHLKYPDDVVKCLKVFFSWLKQDGILRLALPDLGLVAKYYIDKDPMLFKMYGNSIDHYLYKQGSAAERFMFFMRGWEHTIVFDFELISSFLKEARFKDIKKMPFGKSAMGVWKHDRMKMESMFVECKK